MFVVVDFLMFFDLVFLFVDFGLSLALPAAPVDLPLDLLPPLMDFLEAPAAPLDLDAASFAFLPALVWASFLALALSSPFFLF